jgi:hypothetical protein
MDILDWLRAVFGYGTILNDGAPVTGSPGSRTINIVGAASITGDSDTVTVTIPNPSDLVDPVISGTTEYDGTSFSKTFSKQFELQTTGATTTTIASIAIPATCVFRVEFEVEAYSSSAGNPAATWRCSMSYKSVSGTITPLKAALLVSDSDGTNSNAPPTGWTPSVTISGSNLLIQVTGAAATNIDWGTLAQWRIIT